MSFTRLIEIILKQKYTDRTEDAWTAMIAAQAPDVKHMKAQTKRWAPFMDGGAETNDTKEFLGTFAQGI